MTLNKEMSLILKDVKKKFAPIKRHHPIPRVHFNSTYIDFLDIIMVLK
jgi:hypothetical protein